MDDLSELFYDFYILTFSPTYKEPRKRNSRISIYEKTIDDVIIWRIDDRGFPVVRSRVVIGIGGRWSSITGTWVGGNFAGATMSRDQTALVEVRLRGLV